MNEKNANELIDQMIALSTTLYQMSGDGTKDDVFYNIKRVRDDIWERITAALCEDKWIPLAEGLPEPNETVEIWLPNNSYVKIAPAHFHILGTGVKVFSGVTTYSLKEVSHFRRIVGPGEGHNE